MKIQLVSIRACSCKCTFACIIQRVTSIRLLIFQSTANVIIAFDFHIVHPSVAVLEYYSALPHWALSQLLYCKAPGEQHIGQMAPYLHYPSWRVALVPVRVGAGATWFMLCPSNTPQRSAHSLKVE